MFNIKTFKSYSDVSDVELNLKLIQQQALSSTLHIPVTLVLKLTASPFRQTAPPLSAQSDLKTISNLPDQGNALPQLFLSSTQASKKYKSAFKVQIPHVCT